MGCIADMQPRAVACRASLAMTLAAIAMPTHAAGTIEQARAVLTSALQAHRPTIEAWNVAPLGGAALEARLPAQAPHRVDVVQLGARSAVRVTWQRDGEPARSLTLWFAVQGEQKVAISARALTAGDAVVPADVFEAARDVMALGCSPLPVAELPAPGRMRRSISTDHALCREDVEPRPLVAKGDAVTVRFASARVSLTSQAVALHDATVGQSLRLVNPANQLPFEAVVTAPREVEIK